MDPPPSPVCHCSTTSSSCFSSLHNKLLLRESDIPPSNFKSTISITHITTATAILDIDGVRILTDPVFSPAGTTWDRDNGRILEITETPALGLEELPPIDAVLLSHEDHPDNLDELGRRILDGRYVFTTMDGAKKLAPRPGARGMEPWQTTEIALTGKTFEITATPCVHVPNNECTGFILTTDTFGIGSNGLPNAIWFTGDTVYTEDFASIPKRFNVVVVIMNLGSAKIKMPDGELLQITMDGKQGARLFREIGAEVLVPMHYESWKHFTEFKDDLINVFKEEGIAEKVCWLPRGQAKRVI